MSTPLNQTIIQFGQESRRDFDLSCTSGDWQPMDITFPQAFPPQAQLISVIATANDRGVGDPIRNEPVVAVVEDLTLQGFRLWGRNPHECARSSAGFNWLAVAEAPGLEQPPSVGIRLGIVRPQWFAGRCQGPAQLWPVSFGPNRVIGGTGNPPVVLATATNLNVWATTDEYEPVIVSDPVFAYTSGTLYNAAAVATAQAATPGGFVLKGSTSDLVPGNSAFFYAAFAHTHGGSRSLFVETGRVGAKHFEPTDNLGDWRLWAVDFQDPFMTPPTVLVTANDLMEDGTPVPDHGGGVAKAIAAVGIAQNVTTHGFTLMARNSDCGRGFAGFSWVAFGCERFCA